MFDNNDIGPQVRAMLQAELLRIDTVLSLARPGLIIWRTTSAVDASRSPARPQQFDTGRAVLLP
jgi:hypothetical protein